MPRRKRRTPEPDRAACVIYARFSSDKQRDESIEDQVRVCSDWAEGHGLTVVATYADQKKWNEISLHNIAPSGIFAAHRATRDYAEQIWHVPYKKL